ncbi:MAG: DUF2905 domain-containing protein [Acidobacteriota bacterium]|nr:DUF2905 domain-containing protein [Acidobacteriota bacterium]
MGRLIIIAGLTLVAVGVLITFGGRLPIRLGRLPGDITLRGKHATFYFPLVTCLLLSLIISLVSWLLSRR